MLSLDAPAAKLFAMSSSLLQKFHHQTQGRKFLPMNLDSHLGMIFTFSVQDERLGFHLPWWVINLQMATLHNFNSWVKSHLITREPDTISSLVYSIPVRFRLLLNSERWCLGGTLSFSWFGDSWLCILLTNLCPDVRSCF